MFIAHMFFPIGEERIFFFHIYYYLTLICILKYTNWQKKWQIIKWKTKKNCELKAILKFSINILRFLVSFLSKINTRVVLCIIVKGITVVTKVTFRRTELFQSCHCSYDLLFHPSLVCMKNLTRLSIINVSRDFQDFGDPSSVRQCDYIINYGDT